jgi:hypothetical protein
MTAGVVIFAFNNEQIDYLALAEWTTRNVHRHLDLPVCVITNQTDIPSNYTFDHVVHTVATDTHWRHFRDFEKSATWYNGSRVDAYELSPWDHTLVLDADYVVASDQLRTLFDVDQDFLAHRYAYEVTGLNNFDENNYFGRHKMPMSWATVMIFRRSQTAELIFNAMQMIRKNWRHYVELYGIPKYTYRNDMALSIAMNIVDGHTLSMPAIPWPLVSVDAGHPLTQLDQDTYRVDFVDTDDKNKWLVLNHDFHAMGKRHLGDIVANTL